MLPGGWPSWPVPRSLLTTIRGGFYVQAARERKVTLTMTAGEWENLFTLAAAKATGMDEDEARGVGLALVRQAAQQDAGLSAWVDGELTEEEKAAAAPYGG